MADANTKAASKIGKNTTPPNAGKGRPKGAKNKTTAVLKELILEALENNGGVAYLTLQATKQPVAFMALLGKVLPLQVQGDKDSPLHVNLTSPHLDAVLQKLAEIRKNEELTEISDDDG